MTKLGAHNQSNNPVWKWARKEDLSLSVSSLPSHYPIHAQTFVLSHPILQTGKWGWSFKPLFKSQTEISAKNWNWSCRDNFRTQTQNLPDWTSYTKTTDFIWHFITITNMMIKHLSWAGTRPWQSSFNISLLIKSKLCRIQSFMDFFSFDKLQLSKTGNPLNISGWHLHIKVVLHFQTSLIFLPLLIHYKGW